MRDFYYHRIRKAPEARNKSGDYPPVSFDAFKAAYAILTTKLHP